MRMGELSREGREGSEGLKSFDSLVFRFSLLRTSGLRRKIPGFLPYRTNGLKKKFPPQLTFFMEITMYMRPNEL
jgi:hypothetical protein